MIDDNTIVSVKSTLCSPYSVEWPLLEKGETPEILNAIQRTFEPLKGKLGKVKSRGRKFNRCTTKVVGDSLVPVQETSKQDQDLRSQILIGVNEVTRALERGLLRSVVVCRSTKPSHMTNHLLTLSATRETPALCLFKLSEVLSPLLNLKSVMSIGFKKTNEESIFDDLVQLLIRKSPALNLPWLQRSEVSIENLKRDHPRVKLQDNIADEETNLKLKKLDKQDSKQETTSKLDEQILKQKKPGKGLEGLTPGIAECSDKEISKHDLEEKPEKQLTGVKRSIEEVCSEQSGNKQMELSDSCKKSEYVNVRIEKVKVIPKQLKSKRRKKKKKKTKPSEK